MAVEIRDLPVSPAPLAQRNPNAFVRLVLGIASVEGVVKILSVEQRTALDLWVVLGREDLEAFEHIFDLEREYMLAKDSVVVDIHVVSLDRFPEERLPHGTTLYPH